ncbi:MAG: glycosyl hydrolase family 8 [Deltaproteobacteria bacterium]|nr:glycosyl hydrolase family 8 [Deltaproteobacteria bacterium]
MLPHGATSAKATAAYETFKRVTVTADGASDFLRVFKPDSGTVIGSTVSEGMGYGLLLAVYHDDQAVFDQLWRYTAKYLNANGLMDWEVDPQGAVIGKGAASDGDEDIAFALVMASRKWGGRGSLDEAYVTLGVRMIDALLKHAVDVDRNSLWKPGDRWGPRDITNLSYFAPAYFRVFGEVSGKQAAWDAVIDGNYDVLDRTLNDMLGNKNNGLVPAWSNSVGETVSAYTGAATHFQNDSTRTPFRIGQDYCWWKEPRAKSYLNKIAAFYAGEGVANIKDGYNLDGTPRPERPNVATQAASFVGPAGVAFMSDPKYQNQLDEAWAKVATETLTNGTIYYQKSWTALSLLMMAGDMQVLPQK